MKIVEVLVLDIRREGSWELLRKALSKTAWLEGTDPDDIDFEMCEALYNKIVKKYPARIAYLQNAGVDQSYVIMLKRTDTNAWIDTVFCKSFKEGMFKVILTLYAYFKMHINLKDNDRRD